MVKNRERQAKRYLATQVDPVLKPLIRSAVKGKGAFPSDFRLWLHETLCREYGHAGDTSQSKHPTDAIRRLNESIEKDTRPALTCLDHARFPMTYQVFDELAQKAAELDQQYTKECATEEARKQAEERKKQQEAEEAKRAAAQKQKTAGSGKQVKLFLSYARGKDTTPVARSIKRFLEQNAFSVWMDEEGITGR